MEKSINAEEVVAISKEDVANIRNFFSNFEIPMPDALKFALEEFEREESFKNQERIRVTLCEAAITSDHEAFKDQLFASAVANSSKIVYEHQFNKELESTLTKDKLEE